MSRKRQKEVLRQAGEDGDGIAMQALGDMLEEDGMQRMSLPKRGDWLIIWTGAFFHVGLLLGDDHEYYALAPGSVIVYETGPLATFFGQGVAQHCEVIPTATWPRKGATANVSLWPFERVPTSTAQ